VGGTTGLRPCPRCGKTIARGTAFCAHCGAALAMWQVHSAAIQTGPSGGQGKPQPIINASLCVGCGSCVHACPETGTLELIGGKAILPNTGVRVQTNERVERIQRNHHGFEIVTSKGAYRARWVVLAIGKRGTPRRLGVPGEDLTKVSYRLIEADSYQDKHLLVVGGGDSAIEAALALSRSGTNRVTLSYRGDSCQRARERNRKFLETALKSEKIQIRRRSEVVEIGPASVTLIAEGNKVELPNDYAIILIGGESPDDFLRRTGIEIVEKALSV
jgi:thioredoxin reductase